MYMLQQRNFNRNFKKLKKTNQTTTKNNNILVLFLGFIHGHTENLVLVIHYKNYYVNNENEIKSKENTTTTEYSQN